MEYKIVKVISTIIFFLCILTFTNVYASERTDTFKESFIGAYSYVDSKGHYGNFEHFTRNSDGETAYCIEPGVSMSKGSYTGYYNLSTSEKASRVGLTDSQLSEMALIAHFGYGYKGQTSNERLIAAQILIWEIGGRTVTFTSSWDNPDSKISTPTKIKTEMNDIEDLVSNYKKKPAFSTTHAKISLGNSYDFVDNSNNLNGYQVESCTNCSATINGNTLTVTATSVGNGTITLSKGSSAWSNDFIAYYSSAGQNLLVPGYVDPIKVNLTIESIAGKIAINKTDSKTNSCQSVSPDATLKGAVYGVYKENGTFLYDLTIGNNCSVESPRNLELGNYYILEKKSPTGYKLDTSKHYFSITESNVAGIVSINVKDDIYETNLFINKTYLTDKGVSAEIGATFEIYRKSTMEKVATLTIDESARANVILNYGVYIIKQVAGQDGYKFTDDFEFTVNENSKENSYVTLLNEPYAARIKIIKVDQDGKIITKAGIRFKIKDLSTGKYVCQTVSYPNVIEYCEFETDENGVLLTPYPLTTGDYQLEEIDQVIDGYLWNSEPLKFSIDENSNIIESDGFDAVIELRFTNQEVKGKVEIQKKGEKVVIENGSYTYEEILLPNVVFGLYDENWNLIGRYTTDGNGYLQIENLKLGKYFLKELETVDGFVLDETIYEFELVYKDQYTPIITKTFTLKNYLKKGDLEFTKSDVSTGKGIKDTKIEIYTENDELIFSGVTDSEGKIIIKGLFAGKFYIIETEAATGYRLSDEKVYFEVTEDGQIVKANMTNEKITSIIKLHKTDEKGNPLAGVTIGVYDLEGNLVGTYITDENGDIEIELEYGSYYFQEIATLEGYVLSDAKIYFDVTTDGETIKTVLTNEKITSHVKLHKVDEKGNPLAGVTIGLFDLDGNLLGTYITDENGDIEIELEYGSYYFQEIATLDGYVLNDEKVYFDVTENGEYIQRTLVNELEEIDVPDTLSESYINIMAVTIVFIGATFIIISSYKKKRKK